MQINKSLFIVLEGIDCTGKTSLTKLLKKIIPTNKKIMDYFNNKVVFTFEPGGGGSDFESNMRNLIFKHKDNISQTTMAFLFFANRKEHIDKVLRPAIQNNSLIICDRFFLSTLSYQGYCGGVDIEWLNMNMSFISSDIKPDITFMFDINKTDYMKFFKQKQDNSEINSFDFVEEQFDKMCDSYDASIKYLEKQNQKIIRVNGGDKLEINVQNIIKTIENAIDI